MFSQNESVSKLWAKYVNSKIVSIGSLKSNNVKIKNKKSFNIGYISTYRDYNPEMKLYKNYFYKDSIKSEIDLLRHFNKYCKEYDYVPNIIGSAKEDNLSKKEKKFYDDILGKKYIFIKNHKNRKIYSLIDKFKVLIGIDSTLLYENFGRGNKSVFFSYRKMVFPFNSRRFGWPAKLKLSGKFWTSKKDYKSFKKTLNFVVNCKNSQWKSYYKKYYSRVMEFDNNNRKLLNTIKNLLLEN